MNPYEEKITKELSEWQSSMQRSPVGASDKIKSLQHRFNKIIPQKVHDIITRAIKELTRAVLFGADFTTTRVRGPVNLYEAEDHIKERINFYTSSATAEGAITGFGGILSGMADFPIWLSIKMKMLFEIANNYGFDTSDYKERVYLLYVFQLAFSSQRRRIELFHLVSNWEQHQHELPKDINEFDWYTFQQEYRDHLDVAKLLQLIPGIGAVVGAYVNHKLTNRLGKTAMNAYRMRLILQTPKLDKHDGED
ncbi:EcsC family protein [Reichenbachiella ulvae]|uniref:EcsC family protein n=1 Tax=Reichenbachiella ulvae TaxID=2980104 RepID=A0ABT3CZ87_9BACT|nr:EcsC family protein [Reichenbachiella ulvae]MCV9388868.1 EcsC family protein [Reichenbachiella ulvae]